MIEEYFFDTGQVCARDKKLFVLCIYDIVDNKRRIKFAKYLNGYGFRVQKSAFEAHLKSALYEKLLRDIPYYIDLDEDNVRVYRMSGYGEVKIYGQGKNIADDEVMII